MMGTKEEAEVQKKARVVGEVAINKETEEREETVRDTVRRAELKVETSRLARAAQVSRRPPLPGETPGTPMQTEARRPGAPGFCRNLTRLRICKVILSRPRNTAAGTRARLLLESEQG